MPINRIVAVLAGPIASVAGLFYGWLATHDIGLHFGKDQIAKALTFIVTALLTAAVHYAAAHKWLDGWQKWESLLFNNSADPTQTGHATKRQNVDA